MTFNIYRFGFSLAALLAVTMPIAARAQIAGTGQAALSEAQASAELRGAIKRLASDPADSDALIDAGNAALLLGDANAALNFFARADALRPSNSRIKLGLATANVRSENPFEALRYFDEAVRLGMPERTLAADRALAFDLLGNFDRAQSDYRMARSASSSNDLIVRQAISLSLGGKTNEADKLLLPLLQQNDGDAWRARAFLLAARGDFNESIKVARGFMDARSAQKIEIYLRQMPKLTGAQQAAAIHLGHFPVNDIGRDSAVIQSIASNYPASKASGSGRLIPSGEPLGPKGKTKSASDTIKLSRKEREKAAKQASNDAQFPPRILPPVARQPEIAALPIPAPTMPIDAARTRIIAAEKASVNLAAVALPAPIIAVLPPVVASPAVAAAPIQTTPVQTAPVQAAPTIVFAPQTPAPPKAEIVIAAPLPAVVAPPVALPLVFPLAVAPAVPAPPTIAQLLPPQQDSVPAIANLDDKAIIPQAAPAPVLAAVAPAPVAEKAISTFDLGEVVSAIEIPESEKQRDVVPVDLKNLPAPPPKMSLAETPKPEKPSKKTEPAKPEYPARIWVQVATGAVSALPSDMRNFRKKFPALFKGQSAWTSPWSKSSRLIVGPFESLPIAKKWETEFRKGGGGGFVWQSGDGTKVTPLK